MAVFFVKKNINVFVAYTRLLKKPLAINIYSIKAGTRRIDGSEKSKVSDVTITEKGAPNFSDTDRINRVSLDLNRPVLHSTGNTASST
jgi:hypothetical protein